MGRTFKKINEDSNIDKPVKKVGLSLGILFSKEEQNRFGIKYGSIIRLNNAEVEVVPEEEEISDIPKDI